MRLAATARRARRSRRSWRCPSPSQSARGSAVEIPREEGVQDEVDAAVEPGVVAARAEHPFADEAGVLRHLLRRRVLLVRSQLDPHDTVILEQPGGYEPHGPRAQTTA